MLNSNIHQYIITPIKRSQLWKKGYVLFARLKNRIIVFTKARKEKMDTVNNAKFADWLKEGNITRIIHKSVLLIMNDGLKEIQKRFLRIRGLTITVIKSGCWQSTKKQEKLMDMHQQKPIAKEIDKRSIAITTSLLRLNLAQLSNPISVRDAKTIVSHKHITMIMQSLWMSFGFVENVMVKSIEHIFQRERLNLQTPKGDAIVQTTEETCRGEFEAVPPPRKWSVGLL